MNKILFAVLFGIILTMLTGSLNPAFADKDDDEDGHDKDGYDKDTKEKKEKDRHDKDTKGKKEKNRTSLKNLGILQIAAHDFFNVNRCLDPERFPIPLCEVVEGENRLLDMSTVLFDPKSGECDFTASLELDNDCSLYSDEDIALGGEKRNRENIMIFTAGSALGEKYLELRDKHGAEKAYDKIIKKYHKQLKKAFEQTFHKKFPKPQDGVLGHEHNLAVRSVHDFLPEEIKFKGKKVSIFSTELIGEKLSKKEQRYLSSPLDGHFDDLFTGIEFCPIPPDIFCLNVDLFLADFDFAKQFKIKPDFLHHMKETHDGRYDNDENVTKLIIEAFARGINLS